MSKIRLLTTVLLLASTIGVVFSVKPVQASPSIIHFSHSLWTPTITGSGPSVHHSEITIPADSHGTTSDLFAAGLESICTIRGDFDIQVNYQLDVWPSNNGVRVGLDAGPIFQSGTSTMVRASASTHDVRPAGEYYAFPQLVAPSTIFATNDLAGALRLVRTGGTLTGFFSNNNDDNNAGWATAGSVSIDTGDIHFSVHAGSFDVFSHQDVKLSFRDFIINSGQLVCP